MTYLSRYISILLFVCIMAPVLSQEPVAYSSDVIDRIERVENGLLPSIVIEGQNLSMTLTERMAFYKVPGVSVAVINNYQIEWAKGYGVTDALDPVPVTTETLFQAASISKPITATAVMRLVQEGVVALDENINTYLTNWQLPENNFTATEKVTLRHLLSHSAGTTVSGFTGYAEGERLPTTQQILRGEDPANSDPVVVDFIPGTEWHYSGGGYTIIQQAIEDLTEQSFPTSLDTLVLKPTGMTNSTFEQPLSSEDQKRAASGHDSEGTPMIGKWHSYPELAAAGLWTTPTDLARWVIVMQQAYEGESETLLSSVSVAEMFTTEIEEWGLGVGVGGRDSAAWFAHSGANAGFQANLVAFMHNGQGAIIMTNSDNGFALYGEIFRGIAEVYEWPAMGQEVRRIVEIDPTIYDQYVGTYISGLMPITLSREDDQLMLTLPPVAGNLVIPLYPTSETEFFDPQQGTELTFTLNEDGSVREIFATAPGAGEFKFIPLPLP